MVPAVLPIHRSLHVETLLLDEDGLTILASSKTTDAPCPLCDQRSARVHSRYTRTLADLPWAGVAVLLHVQVGKSFCDNATCPRRIFGERLADVAAISARRTDRQQESLTAIAFALGGEAGARLAGQLGMPVSPDTLLRLIRRDPAAMVPTSTVLGVDDWAIHKGLTDGTILIDLARHRPVDLLPDRSSGNLAIWLRAHPGVAIITRDRAGAYAEGARDGAPDATQVADRWHLVDNLADTLETFFCAHRTCLKAAAATLRGHTPEGEQSRSPPEEVYQGKRRCPQPERWRDRLDAAAEAGVAQRRANYDQVRSLQAAGMTVAEMARTVGIAQMTVYRYLREGPPPAGRPRTMLTHPHGPSPRQVASLILRRPERRTAEQRAYLKLLGAEARTIVTAVVVAADFLVMVRRREGERLPTWLEAAEASGIGELERFARTLREDLAAVQAGLTLRHSNGQTEGFDLLRKRVLRAA